MTSSSERASGEKRTRELIVKVAERLFRQVGFPMTTVSDIAREMHMSPANVYRFFAAKSEINEAVCLDLFGEMEAEAEKIAVSPGSAAQKLGNLMRFFQKTYDNQYKFDRNLHYLIEVATIENWNVTHRHMGHMAGILEQIIAKGMESGEIPPGNAPLAARLVNTACTRFCDPRFIGEYEQVPEPTLDQIIDFCWAAIAAPPIRRDKRLF